MKLRLLPLLAASLFAAVLARAANDRYTEAFTRSGAFSATGEISLSNVNGDVIVEAWDRNEILIEGEKYARTEEELKAIELNITLTDSRATIKVHLPKRTRTWFGGESVRGGVRFRLKVPAAATLDEISTVNASIAINGVRGAIDAHSVNGRVSGEDLGGDAELKTVNGQVRAAFASLAQGQRLEFETVNGSVEVTLPAGAGFSVGASVVNGGIATDFPLEVRGRFIGKRLNGTVGDGRATIHARSVNGSVRIRKS